MEHLKHPYSTLITFPVNTTLKDIINQQDFIALISGRPALSDDQQNDIRLQKKVHFESQGKVLDEDTPFTVAVSKQDLVLIIDSNVQLKFRESKGVSITPIMIERFSESLVHRLPIEDGHRPKTSPHLIYPNESLDLLFDTLQGQLSYLTTYLLSHFGDRHEFTTYEIQKQKGATGKVYHEWETGIYRMHGDESGTVNIALASDWYSYLSFI